MPDWIAVILVVGFMAGLAYIVFRAQAESRRGDDIPVTPRPRKPLPTDEEPPLP